mmetsp:Transcript_76493/g.236201  ORF Transcript_76493/g.236201 Transcript_76493/m.236201 type:complete len:156 (+) Transcript_76493:3-470(+)
MRRDAQGRIFFANLVTGDVAWSHPLEGQLRELEGACRECLALPPGDDKIHAHKIVECWQREVQRDVQCWSRIAPDVGRLHFENHETGEVMEEDPAKVLLPGHYLKLRAFTKLLEGDGVELAKLRVACQDGTSRKYKGASVSGRHPAGDRSTCHVF